MGMVRRDKILLLLLFQHTRTGPQTTKLGREDIKPKRAICPQVVPCSVVFKEGVVGYLQSSKCYYHCEDKDGMIKKISSFN